jgi:hypothetical protein
VKGVSKKMRTTLKPAVADLEVRKSSRCGFASLAAASPHSIGEENGTVVSTLPSMMHSRKLMKSKY